MTDMRAIENIRNKILGALIADARASSGRSTADCAALLGISEADYAAFEAGVQTPSLPQLEVIAYHFNVPIEHFWGDETLAVRRGEEAIRESLPQFMVLRERVIGATLRRLRDETGMSLEQLAAQTNVPAERLKAYEMGQQTAPVHVLRNITASLNASLDDLMDGHGSIGTWLRLQTEFDRFRELPDDLREFILLPINRNYLELAVRLSGLSVQRLRNIAEGILDITF
jgi:transcriptional regulator with XRE-family HTH domain